MANVFKRSWQYFYNEFIADSDDEFLVELPLVRNEDRDYPRNDQPTVNQSPTPSDSYISSFAATVRNLNWFGKPKKNETPAEEKYEVIPEPKGPSCNEIVRSYLPSMPSLIGISYFFRSTFTMPKSTGYETDVELGETSEKRSLLSNNN